MLESRVVAASFVDFGVTAMENPKPSGFTWPPSDPPEPQLTVYSNLYLKALNIFRGQVAVLPWLHVSQLQPAFPLPMTPTERCYTIRSKTIRIKLNML